MVTTTNQTPENSEHIILIFQTSNSTNSLQFAPGTKLSIKLDEQNILLWNQEIEGVITTHKLYGHVVNPQIPPQFDK